MESAAPELAGSDCDSISAAIVIIGVGTRQMVAPHLRTGSAVALRNNCVSFGNPRPSVGDFVKKGVSACIYYLHRDKINYSINRHYKPRGMADKLRSAAEILSVIVLPGAR